MEKGNQLSFLDTLIAKENGCLYITGCRKHTFSSIVTSDLRIIAYKPYSIDYTIFDLPGPF